MIDRNYNIPLRSRQPAAFGTTKSAYYKFIIKQGNTVTWENGANHTYAVPARGDLYIVNNWQL